MKLPELNYDKEVLPEMLSILTRLEELERNSLSIKTEIEMHDVSWMADASEFKRNMERVKEHEKDLHVKLKQIKQDFVETVMLFRNKADKEDYEKLKQLIDEWPIQEYITKNEFFRMVEKIKEEKAKLRRF